MSVRKRIWITRKGEPREAWIAHFLDAGGKQRIKTFARKFARKKDAESFHGAIRAVGQMPEPMTDGYRPVKFTASLPRGGWRKGLGREAIAEALRSQCPTLQPTTDSVVVHIIAEMPPSSAVADVDNLLKAVLDALRGVAWVDDTQVCDLAVRRIPSRERLLRITIWQMPDPMVMDIGVLAKAADAFDVNGKRRLHPRQPPCQCDQCAVPA